MGKFGNWIKRHKGLTALVLVAGVAAGGYFYLRNQAEEAMAAMSELAEETAFVERRTIQSAIASTGEVVSDETRTLAASLAGYEILSVDVEVGDIVKAGDVICTFDMSDVEESLEDAEKSLSAAKKQSNLSVESARRAMEQAVETKNYQIESAARNVVSAYDAYEDALEAYADARDSLSELADDVRDARNAYEALAGISEADLAAAVQKAETALAAAETALKGAQAATGGGTAALDTAGGTEGPDPNAINVDEDGGADPDASDGGDADAVDDNADDAAGIEELTAAVTQAQAAVAQAKTAQANHATQLAQARQAYETLRASYDQAESNLDQLESRIDTAWSSYESAEAAYDYTVTAQESSYEGSKDNLSGAKSSAGVATIQQENAVSSYEKQLEKGSLLADIGGTITAVNIHAGDVYAGGAVVTIQDTDALIVVAEIDEYDIADIALGMKAVFKTDATREEQLQGEVIFISPTPTPGSDVTYQVKVKIHSDTSRLRLGMNAKLNIILAETAEVLTVPFDAIQQDEAGNDIVYVVSRGAEGAITKTAVPVTVGVEGDYYVEITGEIAEGAEVSLPSDDVIDFATMMMEMGAPQ